MAIPAIAVRQWLNPDWDKTQFTPVPPRGKPRPCFYLFSIKAHTLKKLTGIYRRDPEKPPAEDMGIQRRHMPERSEEILRYIQDGFPLSRIDRKKLVDQAEVDILRMPGWLPTAVVVNILTETDQRGPKKGKVAQDDLVKVIHESNSPLATIELPPNCGVDDWQPIIHPIEVIDGQHRLWALEEPEEEGNLWPADLKQRLEQIEIPVVAFYGLDSTWQAYLFYTINQLAKRIDISMVFDLYPLLRTEDWLLRFEGPNIYRETRAQDLTILLWGQPESPWKDRIIRLGGREKGKVTQAAFVRSLASSFIRRWHGGGRNPIGGLYGGAGGTHQTFLSWGREQQAAFLIILWQEVKEAIEHADAPWGHYVLNKYHAETGENNPGILFSGDSTLLASDQGVRGFLCVLNDLLWVANDRNIIALIGWDWVRKPTMNDQQAITDAIVQFRQNYTEVVQFIASACVILADFDWRMSSSLSSADPAYSRQASYRGSSGYKEIRRNMLVHIRDKRIAPFGEITEVVIEALRYEIEDES